MSMTCFNCHQGPMQGVTIYRVNKPGEMPAIWACEKHIKDTDTIPDKETVEIVKILEKANRP